MTKVLIVDDEPAVLKSTEVLLAELGYVVVTTTEPPRVLEILRRERPDVVLQDVRMPGLDLMTLIADIRKDPVIGKTPVILFSASMDLRDVAARVGASGHLEKPFRPDDVMKAIASVV